MIKSSSDRTPNDGPSSAASTAHEVTFALPDLATADRVVAELERRYDTTAPDEPVRRRLHVETVDRRLSGHRSALHFAETDRGWRVVWSSARDGCLRTHVLPEPPAFASDLPEGPFRRELARVVDVRRLLPVAEAAGDELALRDKRGKTVARALVEQWSRPGWRKGRLALRVAMVRGYRSEFRDLVRLLRDDLGLGAAVAAHPLAAFGLLDAALGAPSPDPEPALDPAMRTDDAAQRILRALLASIRANEEGTRSALDTEFLHEFRVAVRRTRAALSRFQDVFPARGVERFKRDFRWLGSITGTLRDLDVYLLKYDGYLRGANRSMRAALVPLRTHLERRQAEERAILRRELGSARYRRLLSAWAKFLERPLPARTTRRNARRPVGVFARERLWNLHRRVLRHGRAIRDDTPNDALHALRLDCKKLRYMMEFCGALFPRGAMAAQVRALKRLQTVLGDFNDLEVQQDKLQAMAREMAEAGEAPLATSMAMGRLVERLRERQAEERQGFAQRFRAFDTAANRKRARRLFKPRDDKAGA